MQQPVELYPFFPYFPLLPQEWYLTLVKSQCCLSNEGALFETTDLLTRLPQEDLSTILACKVSAGDVKVYYV